MRRYDFEFDDYKLKLKLFLILGFLFFVFLFGIMALQVSNFFIFISISLGVPILIFRLNFKKIKKVGYAEMTDEKVKFYLNGVENEIYFKEIEYYFVNFHNGASLGLKKKFEKSFGIVSNIYFSNPINFTKFCQEFASEIEEYKKGNNIIVIRKKTFFEQVWIYPFLIIFTLILFILVAVAIYREISYTASFLGAVGFLMVLWSSYLISKRNITEKKIS